MEINWINEFILHWLPVLIIEADFENINYLYISLLTYGVAFNKNIFYIYKDPIQYLNK